ncbi:MAG: hypothetical protein ACPG31_00280 [Planctomycetota bacterium]
MIRFLAILFLATSPCWGAQLSQGHDPILANVGGEIHAIGSAGRSQPLLDIYGASAFPSCLTYDPSTDQIYAVHVRNFWTRFTLTRIDPVTWQTQEIGDFADDISMVACHPVTGQMYGGNIYGGSWYLINKADASLTWLTTLGRNSGWSGLAFNPVDGELYATQDVAGGFWDSHYYRVAVDGTQVWHIESYQSLRGISFHPLGGLYGVDFNSQNPKPYAYSRVSQVGPVHYPLARFDSLGDTAILPAQPQISISPAQPVGGQTVTIEMTRGRAEADTWIAASLQGTGFTYIPALGILMQLQSPYVFAGPFLSDLTGGESVVANVPQMTGATMWLQAVQYRNFSNVASFVIQ